MKHLIGILLVIGILSCKDREPRIVAIETDNLSSEQIDSILTEFKFKYESPIIFDSTNQVLIPISTELLDKRTKFSSDGYYSNNYPRYWNVLFYNRQTGKTQLLTEDKIRISQIHTNSYEKRDGGVEEYKILYEITDIDFNKDKKLNNKDPQYLFSSSIDGNNLKRVSPINESLQDFKVVSGTKQILIRTLRDTNKDSLFNREDESIWYNAELRNENWKIEEMIDSIERRMIGRLYLDQWLKKK